LREWTGDKSLSYNKGLASTGFNYERDNLQDGPWPEKRDEIIRGAA
jgi:hypothetical protein